jgi:ribosomal protein S18 acetylase RimI-like enzyme
MHPLDNPIWYALTSRQADLALGDDRARRFPPGIGPLAGLCDQSEHAYASLAELAQPDESLVLFLDAPARVPAGWTLEVSGELPQMLCERRLPPPPKLPVIELSESDVPEMLALTRLTRPGPFREQTWSLGGYVGIKVAGKLAAMAGERLHVDGYTEISAVCTHPDFQGKGYASALVAVVANRILDRGEIPFLHTGSANTQAIRVYEKLGFRQRRRVHLAVLKAVLAIQSARGSQEEAK